MEIAADMRRSLGASMLAYAMGALLLRFVYDVLQIRAPAIAWPIWDHSSF